MSIVTINFIKKYRLQNVTIKCECEKFGQFVGQKIFRCFKSCNYFYIECCFSRVHQKKFENEYDVKKVTDNLIDSLIGEIKSLKFNVKSCEA